ncbi:MAG: hypothetical protein HZC19_00025 [Candidatus Omnitrophica bacterium]|nr:hypothetical protein [Candidatus Omnitrophota bacterium]
MKKLLILVMAMFFVLSLATFVRAEEKILFSFEKDAQGWEIPDWALEQEDHVGKSIGVAKDVAKDGKSSLKVMADFPGKIWTSVVVEAFEYFDWTPYKAISVDVYIPKEAPVGLKAKLVLTVGESWKWTEMARSISLVPGEWITITANIVPGSEDWKKTVVDDEFKKDVRKVAVRIESNKKPVYNGPIYIDNFKLVK